MTKTDLEEAPERLGESSQNKPHGSLISTISLKTLPFGFGKSVALTTNQGVLPASIRAENEDKT